MLGEVTDEILVDMQKTMEERQCRVGDPNGPLGIVEKVYRRRGRHNAVGIKVIMDTGSIRYLCDFDVYVV